MESSKVMVGDQAACLIRFPAAARSGPIARRHAARIVCLPTRATGRAVRRGPPLPRLSARADLLRPEWTVEVPAELLREVTLRDKRGGMG